MNFGHWVIFSLSLGQWVVATRFLHLQTRIIEQPNIGAKSVSLATTRTHEHTSVFESHGHIECVPYCNR